MKNAIFDLDYTIINFNSHYEVTLQYLKLTNKYKYFLYAFFYDSLLTKLINRTLKVDFQRQLSFFLLTYIDDNVMKESVSEVLSKNRFNNDVIALLNELSLDHNIYIATACPYEIATLIGKKIKNVDRVFATKISDKERDLIVGNKQEILRDKYNIDSNVFISDNHEDFRDSIQDYYFVFNGKLFKRKFR